MVELATTTWGDGPTRILLVHGLSSNAAGWWRLGPDLAALGCTVVAPDLRGHGSSGDGDAFHLEAYRDDVLEMGGGWDVALGHSLGGAVVLACQLADPGFASALVLEDPAIGLDASDELIEWLATDYAEPITIEAIAAKRPRWEPEDVAAKVRALRDAGRHIVAPTVQALAVDLWPELGRVDVPVLVIGADPELDTTVPTSVGEWIAGATNATYIPVPGAGHSIHRDSYDAFWSELETWLRAAKVM